MPNTMTQLEINDVLSSIRRLVSGEKPDRKSAGLPSDDFFVLTPAHRVEAESDAATSHSEIPLPPVEEPVVLENSLETLELINPAFPPQASENTENDAEEAETTAILMELFPQPEPEAESGPDHQTVENTQTLEDRIAELEEAVNRSEGEWEPDGSEVDTMQLPKRHLFEVTDGTPKWAGHEELEKVENQASPKPDEILDEAVEDLAEEIVSTPELPLQLAEVATFTHIPRKVYDTKKVGSPAQNPKSGEVVQGDEDIFVDEDLLRRVVSDIVRDELQGKLGESITRNIRRMVRREIEQTLSLRKLD
ncbi:MAG: hypothetical protein ACU0CA_09135 [Paracoccaceae bacterium]